MPISSSLLPKRQPSPTETQCKKNFESVALHPLR